MPLVMDIEALKRERLRNWRQAGERRVVSPEQAAAFIQEVGVATLFAASPEFPSLYQAHMGDPSPPVSNSWDSPAGHVYTWRWELGRPHAAFYGVVVAKKPTWVAFDRLPLVLGALMERRAPEDLYAAGELSADGLKLAKAFDGSDGILTTKELRARGGFEKGKENRTAYLKAVEELDSRLWLAKRCGQDGDEMSHALIRMYYPDATREGLAMEPVAALARLLGDVVRHSVYFDPKPLGRHLRAPVATLDSALSRLVDEGAIHPESFGKEKLYVGAAFA